MTWEVELGSRWSLPCRLGCQGIRCWHLRRCTGKETPAAAELWAVSERILRSCEGTDLRREGVCGLGEQQGSEPGQTSGLTFFCLLNWLSAARCPLALPVPPGDHSPRPLAPLSLLTVGGACPRSCLVIRIFLLQGPQKSLLLSCWPELCPLHMAEPTALEN